jgi:hypothetical protein
MPRRKIQHGIAPAGFPTGSLSCVPLQDPGSPPPARPGTLPQSHNRATGIVDTGLPNAPEKPREGARLRRPSRLKNLLHPAGKASRSRSTSRFPLITERWKRQSGAVPGRTSSTAAGDAVVTTTPPQAWSASVSPAGVWSALVWPARESPLRVSSVAAPPPRARSAPDPLPAG